MKTIPKNHASKGNETLKKIREVVNSMALEKKFNDIIIREICKRANITIGTFYYYFESKNDLLLDRFLQAGDYFRTVESDYSNIDEILAIKDVYHKYRDYLLGRNYPLFKKYYQVMVDEYDRWHETQPYIFPEVFRKLVIRGQKNGTICKRFSVESLTKFFLSILSGIAINYAIRDQEFLDNDEYLQVVDSAVEHFRNTESLANR